MAVVETLRWLNCCYLDSPEADIMSPKNCGMSFSQFTEAISWKKSFNNCVQFSCLCSTVKDIPIPQPAKAMAETGSANFAQIWRTPRRWEGSTDRDSRVPQVVFWCPHMHHHGIWGYVLIQHLRFGRHGNWVLWEWSEEDDKTTVT